MLDQDCTQQQQQQLATHRCELICQQQGCLHSSCSCCLVFCTLFDLDCQGNKTT